MLEELELVILLIPSRCSVDVGTSNNFSNMVLYIVNKYGSYYHWSPMFSPLFLPEHKRKLSFQPPGRTVGPRDSFWQIKCMEMPCISSGLLQPQVSFNSLVPFPCHREHKQSRWWHLSWLGSWMIIWSRLQPTFIVYGMEWKLNYIFVTWDYNNWGKELLEHNLAYFY